MHATATLTPTRARIRRTLALLLFVLGLTVAGAVTATDADARPQHDPAVTVCAPLPTCGGTDHAPRIIEKRAKIG